MKILKEYVKKFAFRYLKVGAPKYDFNVEPIQMALLVNEIERMKTASVYDHRRSLARRRKGITHNSFAFETRERFFKISA